MPRRRAPAPAPKADLRDILELLSKVKGEAYALSERRNSVGSHRLGEGTGGGGGPEEAVDRLDEIRAGLLAIVQRRPIP